MNGGLLLFAGLALVTVATPGPTTLLTLNQGARHGLRAALPGVAGAVLSDFVLIAAVAAGLGGLLTQSAVAFEWLRWTGVAYLVWLGWRLLRPPAAAALAAPRLKTGEHATALCRRSFTVAITNPKGYLFFSALLPSFIDASTALWPQYLQLALVFAGIDAVVLLAWAAAGAAGAHHLGPGALRRSEQASGIALMALAAGLALWARSDAQTPHGPPAPTG